MKALLISDSHGYRKSLKQALECAGRVDMIFHMGDIEGDANYLRENAGCPVYIVAGNNDWHSDLPDEAYTDVEGYKIMLTHGHRYRVNYNLDELEIMGMAMEKDIVMFGHTHVPVIEKREGIYLVNPGSLSFPRQRDREKTFIIMEINDGKIHFDLKCLK